MKFSTKAIRAGQQPDAGTGSVIVPVYQTVNFVFDDVGRPHGYEYSRSANPTRTALEQCLASLEEARFGMAFASGMAAVDAVCSLLRPGDHVVSSRQIYGGTSRLFEMVYRPRGVTFTDAPHMIHRHGDGTEEWMTFFEDPEGRPLALMAQIRKR